ncbi:MAG TPA: hypothetical protein VJB70_03845 [Candidatus Paceibacterota bacterium]
MEVYVFSKPFFAETLALLLYYAWKTAPIWLPSALLFFFWISFVHHRRTRFLDKQRPVLLEIKVPKNVDKSPLAMEVALNSIYQTSGESNWYDRAILGKVRSDFSLEMVSIEGDVHFFIRTRPFLRKNIESHIYSQYPTAEIYEVEDYTPSVPFAQKDSDWNLFGLEYTLTKPDPYPIKTYIDYELDRDKFEEKKVDPITPTLEFLGGIGKNEQIWIQILVQANKGKKDPTTPWKGRDWQGEAKELIAKIMEDAKDRSGAVSEEGNDFRLAMLTEGERNAIKAIERSVSKLGFDCGIRALYLGRKESFEPGNIAGLFGAFRQYNSNDLNGFKQARFTDVDYPWQDYFDFAPNPFSAKGDRVGKMKWKIFDAYRRRSWFHPPYERKPFVLNSEELATIFHFPGRVSETPTFERIASKKSEPPANLPM